MLTPEQIRELAEILAGLAKQAAELGLRIDAVSRRLSNPGSPDDDHKD